MQLQLCTAPAPRESGCTRSSLSRKSSRSLCLAQPTTNPSLGPGERRYPAPEPPPDSQDSPEQAPPASCPVPVALRTALPCGWLTRRGGTYLQSLTLDERRRQEGSAVLTWRLPPDFQLFLGLTPPKPDAPAARPAHSVWETSRLFPEHRVIRVAPYLPFQPETLASSLFPFIFSSGGCS